MRKMKTNVGTISSHAAAYLYGSGDDVSAFSTNAGSVGRSSVKTEAANTSLYDISRAKPPAAARPGMASGKVTVANAPGRLHPNTWAASSRSAGIAASTLELISTTNGSVSAVCMNATAHTES